MAFRDPATIAVVEDDAALRDSIGALIEAAGYTYLGFASAEAFLEQSSRQPPDCVVLDLHMGGMDGIKLQRRIAVGAPAVPTLAMSGDASEGEVRQLMAGGAFEFLPKPFDAFRLLDYLDRMLARVSRRG